MTFIPSRGRWGSRCWAEPFSGHGAVEAASFQGHWEQRWEQRHLCELTVADVVRRAVAAVSGRSVSKPNPPVLPVCLRATRCPVIHSFLLKWAGACAESPE